MKMFFNCTELCGSDFVVIQNRTIAPCFAKIVISFPCFTVMSAVCAYFAAQSQRNYIRNRFSILLINIRIIFTVMLLLVPILKNGALKYQTNHVLYIVDVSQLLWQCFGWSLHLFYLVKLRRSITRNVRGVALVSVSLFIVMVSELVQLWGSVALAFSPSSVVYNLIASCLTVSCAICYFITLIPAGGMPSYYGYSVINDDDESDSENFIYTSPRGYGTFYEEQNAYDLGVAEEEHNCISKLTFWWIRKLMVKGSKGLIKTEGDLYDLPGALKTETVVSQVQNYYQSVSASALAGSVEELRFLESQGSEIENVTFHRKRRLLINILNSCFGLEFYSLGVLRILADASTFAGPLLLNYLIIFLESPTEPMSNGYWYFAGLSASALLSAFFNTHFNYLVNRVSLKIRAAIIYLIYQKALSVNSCTLSTFNTGEIVNFMSSDTDRIVNFCQSFHQFWSLPVQIIIALVLLHQQIGLSFLAGFSFAVLLIPVNKWLANKISILSTERMDRKDKRIKLMSELLSGIRVVKMHAWEGQFAYQVGAIRKQEMKFLKSRKYLDAFCVYFWATTPVIISVLTFTMYSSLGNTLTASKVFTCLSLFNLLITPLNAFPWVINGIIEASVSLKRVQRFLSLRDLYPHEYYSSVTNSGNTVEVADAQFSWKEEEEQEDDSYLFSGERQFILGPLNVKVVKGSFYGIAGAVGSGKSSFLAAILAELHLRQGSVAVNRQGSQGAGSSISSSQSFSEFFGGVGYVAQEPWIQHSTIQQNILFGKPFNVFRYNHVLEACGLLDDLQLLPSGDQTEVGERGVTLSGGQKARISLARAVYQDLDIYLLDDPFSAVDVHVAEHIYQNCIRRLLYGKTVILCTHHLQYLKDADTVLVLKNGHPVAQGLPSDVLPTNVLELLDLPLSSSVSKTKEKCEMLQEASVKFQPKNGNQLVQEEERETGSLRWTVYNMYAKAVGWATAFVVIISMFLMQGSKVASDWWLAFWVSDIKSHSGNETAKENEPLGGQGVQFYLLVFGGIAILNSLFTLIRAFAFAFGGIQAAVKIHDALLTRILKAPVRFFDVTPLGRILNRFSSDLNMIDDSLPFIMNIFLAQLFGVMGSLVVTCYGLPWMIIVFIPLGAAYLSVQNYYRHTSRELKRLNSTTLSPLYAHFTETLSGLTTIKAMAATRRFARENDEKLDANQQTSFAGTCASQWLALNLQMIGVAVVTAVSFLAVVQHHFSSVDPGMVGLVVAYALSITSFLNGVVSSFTETEKEMVSVERAMQYIEGVRSEKRLGIMKPPGGWPLHGVVTLKQVKLRYHPSYPLALLGVSFETKPGEKIGIVGRTGSGKSSLFQALFRIVELEEGEILIDGVNIAHLDLHDLRSRLAIIPQDPFLFSGTVKSNLDPGEIHSEHELMQVLRHCQMADTINQIGGLSAEVTERGQEFSVGQRQLLCLARALLARTKILCIDEATASVDSETDQAIQKTLRLPFKNTTVLTIAHRLDTIMDSDRILVMSSGALVESGKPQNLLKNPLSYFSTFVHPVKGQKTGQ